MSDADAKLTTINMNKIKGQDDPFKLSDLLKQLSEKFPLDTLSALVNMPMDEIETMLDFDTLVREQTPPKKTRQYIVVPEGKKEGDRLYMDDLDILKKEVDG